MMRRVLLLLSLLLLQGCTRDLWERALAKDVDMGYIKGVASVKGKSAPAEYLIVSYRRSWPSYYFSLTYDYAIPLVDGHVPELFDYRGLQTNEKAIFNDLSQERLNRIQNYKFSKESYDLAQHMQFEGTSNPKPGQSGAFFSQDGLIVLSKSPPVAYPLHPCCKIIIPSGASVIGLRSKAIILPAKQHRFPEEQRKDILASVFLTPLTLVTDSCIVIIGIFSYPLEKLTL